MVNAPLQQVATAAAINGHEAPLSLARMRVEETTPAV
jgi:hypothetical protein